MELDDKPNLTDETEIVSDDESETDELDLGAEELAVVEDEPVSPEVLLLQELLELRHLGKIEHFIIRPDEECILICAKEEPDKPRIYFLSKELNTAEYNHFEATVLQSDYLNLKEWAPEYHYKEGDLIYESYAVYRAKEEHVSSDQAFADDINKWQQIVSTLNNSSTNALSSVVNITGKDDTLTITDGMGATSTVTINNVQNAKQDVHGVDLDSYVHQVAGTDDTLTITDGKGNASKIVVNKVRNAKQDMHGVDIDSYVHSVVKANSDDTFTVTDGKGTSSNITINNVQNAQKDIHGVALDSYIHSITRVNNDLKIVTGDGTTALVPITCVSAYIQQIAGKDDTLTITDSSGNVSTIVINNVKTAKQDIHGTDLDSYVLSVTGTNDTLTITDGKGGTSNVTVNQVQNAKQDTNGVAIDSYVHSVTKQGDDLKVVAGDGTVNLIPVASSSAAATISDWVAGTSYTKDTLVMYQGIAYRCTTPNSDTAFQSANWERIVSKGLVLDWTQSTAYNIGDIVADSNSLYRCITAHTSSGNFTNDFANWVLIGQSGGGSGGGGSSSYSQVTKLSATAGTQAVIPIAKTLTFNLPPVEVLKFKAGLQNQTTTVYDFNSGDSADFEPNKYLVFDGTVHLQTKYQINATRPTALGSGWLQESDEIDMSEYKTVEAVNIV